MPDVHRRHRREHGRAVLHHQRERLVGVELGQQDDGGPAAERDVHHRRSARTCGTAAGRRTRRRRARRSNGSISAQCTCSMIARCEPTAPFGRARRAARVEDRGGGRAGAPTSCRSIGVGRRRLVLQARERDRPHRRPARSTVSSGTPAARGRGRGLAEHRRGDDEDVGAGVAQHELDLVGLEEQVDRHDDRAERQHARSRRGRSRARSARSSRRGRPARCRGRAGRPRTRGSGPRARRSGSSWSPMKEARCGRGAVRRSRRGCRDRQRAVAAPSSGVRRGGRGSSVVPFSSWWSGRGCAARRGRGARCTSSGPSARRSGPDAGEHLGQRLVAGQTPAAPKSWIARSRICCTARGHRDLDRLDLGHRRAVADGVHEPGGLEHEQPQRLDLDAGLGDPLAHDALLGERPAERAPRRRALDARGRAPARAMPSDAHAVVDPARDRAGPARSRSPSPSPARRFAAGTRTSSKRDLGVAAVVAVVVAEHGQRAHDPHARGVARHQDHATADGAARRRVGLAHDDEDRGSRGSSRPSTTTCGR